MTKLLRMTALMVAMAAPAFAWAGGTGTFVGDEGSFSDTSAVGGALNDTFTFTIPAGTGDWEITSPIGGKSIGISNFAVSLYDGTTLETGVFTSTIVGKPIFLVPTNVWTESYADLAAGVYTLDFTGTFKSGGGSYAGTFLITPAVPEPSTWAAMGMGLLLMAGVTFRKRQNLG